MKKTMMSVAVACAALTGTLITGTVLIGCGGSSTSDDASEIAGTEFVSNENTSGSVELELNSEQIPVGGSAGFLFKVKDASGSPVASVSTACDTEAGLALLDPTSGRGLTDSFGSVSGVLGCENPGSFMVGCRLGAGGASRAFASVKCIGDVPEGFNGFTGAGGGTLGAGGGVVDPSVGGPGLDLDLQLLRVTSITVRNITGEVDSAPQIDTAPNLCDGGTPADATDDTVEPWGDDEVDIAISNGTNRRVVITGFDYTVKGGRSDGSDARSPFIRAVGEINPNATAPVTITGTIFDSTGAGVKTYGDAVTPIPFTLGARNVRFTIYGTTDRDESIKIAAGINMNFDLYNECGVD